MSFKKDKRVINKATNYYTKWIREESKWKKSEKVEQKTTNWAIRKPMHDPMPYGEIKIQFDVLDIHNNVGKLEYIMDEYIRDQVNEAYGAKDESVGATQKYLKANPIINKYGFQITKARFKIEGKKYGKRQPIQKLTAGSLNKVIASIEKNGREDKKTIEFIAKAVEEVQKSIWKVGDLQLQKDLEKFLYTNLADNTEQALFSNEGVDAFNDLRKKQNKHPVFNLRFVEDGEKRFPLGNSLDNKHKMMEATDGNNMFFNVYWDDEKEKRNFETVALIDVIKHQKEQAKLPKEERTEVPIKNEMGEFLFSISPNELLFIPTNIEVKKGKVDFNNLNASQIQRVYKMTSTTQNKLQCQPLHYASYINKNENGSGNKTERVLSFENTEDITDKKGKLVIIKDQC